MFSTILTGMQKILLIVTAFAVATGISEFMVIHTGTSAYWGNATAMLAIATLVIGSISWCFYDAKHYKQSAKRRKLVRKLCLWIMLFWAIGFLLEDKLVEQSQSFYTNQTALTFHQWYLQISTAILICALIIVTFYGFVAQRIKPS